jgi:hypothetical protein
MGVRLSSQYTAALLRGHVGGGLSFFVRRVRLHALRYRVAANGRLAVDLVLAATR